MRRSGRVLTGVDRVELAYLRALVAAAEPVFGLIRSRYGYILLGPEGVADLLPVFTDGGEGQWATARRGARARVIPPLLGWALRRHLPAGCAYLNVGHSNLSGRVLRTLRHCGVPIAVLIHDVIPLEYPQYQRPESVRGFTDMMTRVGQYADLVIYNSADTQRRAEQTWPAPPKGIVAHLGTDLRPAEPAGLSVPGRPYFVVVGTIEPRKNHAFLLDLWPDLGLTPPGLVIAGGRGWNNAVVFDRLDALPSDGPIREMPGLSDGALAALIEGSAGVLFPSHAEGFGLPATEAAARGVPVVVNDLAVYREILGDIPIYASVSDRYLWINKIKELATAGPDAQQPTPFVPPTWDAHFKSVLRLT